MTRKESPEQIVNTPFGGTLRCWECREGVRDEMVLICPGGGYWFLSPREAEPVMEVWKEQGYHGAILDYCLEKEVLGTGPVEEAAWAMRWLRTNTEWKDKCHKIWVMGFSAGGHLAASLGALWNEDEIFTRKEQPLNRPDGLILGYPVISMGKYGHERSRQRLTGGQEKLIRMFSLEERDLSGNPPVFLWGTQTDEKVPVENSLMYLRKLTQDGIRCEYHMFHQGLHGMSLATEAVESEEENMHPDPHIAQWTRLCLEWMEEVGKKKE